MRIRLRTPKTISSAWLVRILADTGRVHACSDCASRMFVPSSDGMCPVCRSAGERRDAALAGIVEDQLGADWA